MSKGEPGKGGILICRDAASAQSLPQAAKLPVQGHRAPGKQSSGLFSVVRAPGKLSGGQFSARTGRQTPVERVGRPLSMGPAGPWEVALTKNACIVSSRRQAQWACRFRRRRNCHGSNQRFETRHRKTDEVVLLREKGQISDTAGGATSSDPALRPAPLTLAGSLGPSAPLNRSLWSLGKAFGRAVGEFPSL